MSKIIVNGNPVDFKPGQTLSGLLSALGVDPCRAVVELNCEVVMREKLGEVSVAEGDRIEIVRFVGGG